MKKEITTIIAFLLLISICLSGCMKPQPDNDYEPVNTTNDEEKNDATGDVNTDTHIPSDSSCSIDLIIKDNHQIHASVYAPDLNECPSYRLEPIQFDPKVAVRILLPDDNSTYTIEYDDRRNQTVLSTESGNILYARSISLMYMRDGTESNKFDAIGDLLTRYAEAHPEKQTDSLDFMTMDDAILMAEKMLKDLGICWQPVLQTSMGMDHQKMMQYQQELYAADKNLEYKTYDPFGKVYVLENLTEADDSYIFRFGFMYNDLPIFGFDNEPSVQFQDGVLPPSQSYAEIIITRDGVRYFDMIGGYRIVETYESKPILSAEEAVEKYKEKWDMTLMPMPEDNWRVPLLYLEYLPITMDDGKVLIPYWCFSREAELTNTKTGEKFWTALGGIRLNAFTGEEHAYGG